MLTLIAVGLLTAAPTLDDVLAERKKFDDECKAGKAASCTELGAIYELGLAVEPDEAKAFALYQKACDLEHRPGCTQLGLMYKTGRTVPVDIAKAVSLFRRGCEAAVRDAWDFANLVRAVPSLLPGPTRAVGTEGCPVDHPGVQAAGLALMPSCCGVGTKRLSKRTLAQQPRTQIRFVNTPQHGAPTIARAGLHQAEAPSASHGRWHRGAARVARDRVRRCGILHETVEDDVHSGRLLNTPQRRGAERATRDSRRPEHLGLSRRPVRSRGFPTERLTLGQSGRKQTPEGAAMPPPVAKSSRNGKWRVSPSGAASRTAFREPSATRHVLLHRCPPSIRRPSLTWPRSPRASTG